MHRSRFLGDLAPAAAPGGEMDHSDVELGPVKTPRDSGKRDFDEVMRGIKVLGLAVRMNSVLVRLVTSAANTVHKLAKGMGDDVSGRQTLHSAADELLTSVLAAGTMPTRKTEEDTQDEITAENAMRGADGDFEAVNASLAARQFSKDWRELQRHGHRGVSRERFIELGLQRIKTKELKS